MIDVIEVISQRNLNDFLKLPFTLYKHDPLYVPPLIKELKKQFSCENPFFLHAHVRSFLAKKDGTVEGRIVSIVNKRHIEFHNEKAGFFGFFESSNNQDVAMALLSKVSYVLKEEEMEIMRGPMNFSTNEECGFLIEGFETPSMFMTPYNPPFYNELMESCGLKKVKDLYAYICDVPEEISPKIHRVADIAIKSGITVRAINKKKFKSEMHIFQDVYNSAWEKNWGFVPLTNEELQYLGKNLKPIVVPDLILIAETDKEPVGFLGLLPDYNFVLEHMNGKMNPLTMMKALYYSRKIKNLRLLLLGIKAKYRKRGVDALLLREGFMNVKKGGYRRVEFSWILEDNIPVKRLIEMVEGKLYKTYRIYEKKL